MVWGRHGHYMVMGGMIGAVTKSVRVRAACVVGKACLASWAKLHTLPHVSRPAMRANLSPLVPTGRATIIGYYPMAYLTYEGKILALDIFSCLLFP